VRRTARQVLEANDRGDHTVASPHVYPYQWLWDSGFIALGWATIDGARAWRELETVLRGQAPDGFVPHVLAHRAPGRRFPDPDLWGRPGDPATSGITQPPVLASVALRLLEHARGAGAQSRRQGEAAALRLWPSLMAFHRWLHRERDPLGLGLVVSVHPWETGMDDSPAWDSPLAAVAPRAGPGPPELPGPTADRPGAAAYPRYLGLVDELRAAGYQSSALAVRGSFRVADAGTNAVMARADADLALLGRRLGAGTGDIEEAQGWARRSAEALSTLWDDDAGHFLSHDLVTGRALRPATSASFLGLWSGAASPSQVQRLAAHVEGWARGWHPVPSSDPEAASFDPRGFWRGSVWVNVNWMIAQGLGEHGEGALAQRMAADSRALLQGAGMREHFHARSGEGLGATDFSWTAALARWWLGME